MYNFLLVKGVMNDLHICKLRKTVLPALTIGKAQLCYQNVSIFQFLNCRRRNKYNCALANCWWVKFL